MRRAIVLVSALLVGGILLSPEVTIGSDAEVLPKGVWTVNLGSKFYLPIDKRYNEAGKPEDVATDFNRTLGANLFPDLAQLQPVIDLLDPASGAANIGASKVSFEYHIDQVELTVGYGLTEKLTVGAVAPYLWQRNDVTARLDTTKANIGKNPVYQLGVFTGVPGLEPLDGAPLIPIAVGNLIGLPVQTLSTDEVQQILGAGLDINGDGVIDIPGFGFKPIRTWEGQGFGDIDIGLKYQYYKSKEWRLASQFGVRLPTGKVDDPDNLVDRGFGTGAWALLFRLNNDYTGIRNVTLNASVNYDMYLPDRQTLRVPDDVNRPITANKEKVKRDLGDVVELEASSKWAFTKVFSWSLLYKYGHSFKDRISGGKGFNYKSLEDETNYTEHVLVTGLGYTTLPMFLAKKFPLPLNVALNYRNRFAGRYNVFRSQYISLDVQVYF
jgi:hypothetical protein